MGGPRIATRNPSRTRSPAAAPANAFAISRLQLVQRRAETGGQGLRHIALVGEIEPRLDLGAQVDQRRPPGLRAPSQRDRAPAPSACRRCISVSAAIRSARPSTSVRSSLPLTKARRMNSPGSASRSPLFREQIEERLRRTARLPCSCSSAMSSPVSLRGRGKPQHKSLVDHLAVAGRRSVRSAALPRLGKRSAQRREQPPGARPGDAHDRDAGRNGAARKRVYGIHAHHRTRSTDEPPRRLDQPLSSPARRQSGRLVALDTRGFRRGEAAERADPSLHRLRRLPLVPCHGARELQRRRQPPSFSTTNFVSIKVDREERPEVDQIYMRALHALGEQGGWPLTMFLTPDAEPFWGGTYFPPEPRWGRPELPPDPGAVSAAWQAQDAAVTQNAAAAPRAPEPAGPATTAAPPDRDMLDRAGRPSRASGTWSAAASTARRNSPTPSVLDALWRAYLRTGDETYRAAVLTTLTYLCQGGIYDHLGGGFARYSVDAAWLVPHFEKMLYDNGQLLSALAFAYRETAQPFVPGTNRRNSRLARARDAAARRRLRLQPRRRHRARGGPDLYLVLGRARQPSSAMISPASPPSTSVTGGNWEGRIILNRLARIVRTGLVMPREADLEATRRRLLDVRNRRPQPGARRQGARRLERPGDLRPRAGRARHRKPTRPHTRRRAAFRFVAESMSDGDRLAHSSLEGSCVCPRPRHRLRQHDPRRARPLRARRRRRLSRAGEAWFAAADAHHFDTKSARLQSRRGRCAAADRAATFDSRRSHARRHRHDGRERRDALHADRR